MSCYTSDYLPEYRDATGFLHAGVSHAGLPYRAGPHPPIPPTPAPDAPPLPPDLPDDPSRPPMSEPLRPIPIPPPDNPPAPEMAPRAAHSH